MRTRTTGLAVLTSILLASGSCGPGVEETTGWLELEIAHSFHPPIVFTLHANRHESTAQLTAEVYSGKGGYDWGEIAKTVKKNITKAVFQEL